VLAPLADRGSLAALALVASALPAPRALGTDPLAAWRQE
jgi:hypothetical protein